MHTLHLSITREIIHVLFLTILHIYLAPKIEFHFSMGPYLLDLGLSDGRLLLDLEFHMGESYGEGRVASSTGP